MTELPSASAKLYQYLIERHWNGRALVGPDVGVRFNSRIGRFLKSYLQAVDWNDDMVYFQAQGYWVKSLWLIADTFDQAASETARNASDYMLNAQTREGYWAYPNLEWRGRVATVEGCFASLGLLDAYARTDHESYLEGCMSWIAYLHDSIGFRDQRSRDKLAVNYFAGTTGRLGGVPNNSTLLLWLYARFSEVTGASGVLEYAERIINWLRSVQLPSGELPYSVGADTGGGRDHFLCYQYNAFEFLDLAAYLDITGDGSVRLILEQLAQFLSTGAQPNGSCMYECGTQFPETIYYNVALARALSVADRLGFGDYAEPAARGFAHTLELQNDNGGFPYYSRRTYGVLSDRRSYPRNLAMILNHLLEEARDGVVT